jgi:hypothetical protein
MPPWAAKKPKIPKAHTGISRSGLVAKKQSINPGRNRFFIHLKIVIGNFSCTYSSNLA